MFDGVEDRPMPDLRIENAMMNRGKLVTMIRIPGATDRMVSRPNVRMIQLATEPLIGVLRMSGVVVCASAPPAHPDNRRTTRAAAIFRIA